MDEKPADSSPSDGTDQKTNKTTSTRSTLDDLISGKARNGDWNFVTQSHYDPDELRDLTTVVISVIAESEGVSITHIKSPPLHEAVDIESVDNALFGRPAANKSDTDSTIEFRYNQYKVRVESNGWVSVFSHT